MSASIALAFPLERTFPLEPAAAPVLRPAPFLQTTPVHRSLLRFLTCGSVDDGKSTLIGRLLYDSHSVLDDQLVALDRDSRKFGTQGEELDLALLVDGLSAEREQGITIDVAYRYFSTPKRSFIVADTPGHEQYTRNMATGASNAELAIILVDATKGLLAQTRRHSYIASMLGVRHVVLAVNKMDLVGFDQEVFQNIVKAYRQSAEGLNFLSIVCIPLSARHGDNVATRSPRLPWHKGPVLLDYLETVSVVSTEAHAAVLNDTNTIPFRFPVQWVNRPDLTFRGYAGMITCGTIARGDTVAVLPGRQHSRIARIVTADGDLEQAVSGQSVTLTLTDELDVSRGDVIVRADDVLGAQGEITARLLWMAEEPLTEASQYVVKLGTASANASIDKLHHAIDIHSYAAKPADILRMNEIGVVRLSFDRPMVATDYARDRELGGFILIDRMSNQTVAIGLVDSAAAPPPMVSVIAPMSVIAPIAAPAALTPRIPVSRFLASRSGVFGRVPGASGSRQRNDFYKTLTRDTAERALLWGLVFLLAGSVALAFAVTAASILCRPVIRHLVDAIWRETPAQASRTAELENGV